MRCVIVDDNEPFVREARELLEREGFEVIGVATSSSQALQTVATLQPDLTLVDIDLGHESGFDLARALVDAPGQVRSSVILISAHAESDFVELVAASPAAGFVSKVELSARAVRAVLESAADNAVTPRSGR